MPIGLVPPALLIQSSDTQSEESSHDDGHESPPSPVDHRLEESEVFRRKAILDTHPELAELDESEATAGEELRKQVRPERSEQWADVRRSCKRMCRTMLAPRVSCRPTRPPKAWTSSLSLSRLLKLYLEPPVCLWIDPQG